MSKITSNMDDESEPNQCSNDQNTTKRRSSLYKPSVQDEKYLKNSVDVFLSLQNQLDFVTTDTPITWERLSKGYRIVDFELERIEQSLEFLKNYYFCSDLICQTSTLYIDSLMVRKYQDFILDTVPERNSFCALEEGTGQIVGMAIAKMKYKDNEPEHDNKAYTSTTVFDVLKLDANLRSQANVYKCFKVDRYFCIHLVCVKPDLRGDGIGTSLIRACLAKAQCIQSPVCVGIFSAGAGYSVAKKFGFNELSSSPWIVFEETNPNSLTQSLLLCMGIVLPVKKVVESIASNSLIN